MQVKERDITYLLDTPHSLSSRTIQNLTTLELFPGAGGLALGTHSAGFRHLAMIEWDCFAVETLRDNSKRVLDLDPDLIFHQDVRTFDYNLFVDKVDLLSGGPPCQPFSTSGRSLGPDDPRNMFPAFLDAVPIVRPKAILIENVKGLLRQRFQNYFSYILKRLQFPFLKQTAGEKWQDHYQRLLAVKENDFSDEEQYVVTHQLINTSDYGVPQSRERVLVSAFRRDLGIDVFHIDITHSKEALLVDQWITGAYWKRHGVFPYDYLGPINKRLVETLQQQPLPACTNAKLPWKTVRDVLNDLPPPVMRGEVEQITNHIQHPGARIYAGHQGSHWDYPAKVLKAGTHGTPGGENILYVPQEGILRYFTTREAARLQTFPDDWKFHGTWGACIRQLGNAVPAEVIKIFATKMSECLVNVIQQ